MKVFFVPKTFDISNFSLATLFRLSVLLFSFARCIEQLKRVVVFDISLSKHANDRFSFNYFGQYCWMEIVNGYIQIERRSSDRKGNISWRAVFSSLCLECVCLSVYCTNYRFSSSHRTISSIHKQRENK